MNDQDDQNRADDNLIPHDFDVPKLIELGKVLAGTLIIFDKQVGEVSGRIDMFTERVDKLAPGELEGFAPMTGTLRELARRQRVAASAADRLVRTIERR